MWQSLGLVCEVDAGRACEEWVGDLNLEELGLHGNRLTALGISQLLGLELFLPLLGCFVHDLVAGLLELVVLEVEHFTEGV